MPLPTPKMVISHKKTNKTYLVISIIPLARACFSIQIPHNSLLRRVHVATLYVHTGSCFVENISHLLGSGVTEMGLRGLVRVGVRWPERKLNQGLAEEDGEMGGCGVGARWRALDLFLVENNKQQLRFKQGNETGKWGYSPVAVLANEFDF